MAAGIGAITVSKNAIKKASSVLYVQDISFAGDGAYPTGGTAGFQASVRAITGDQREIVVVDDVGAIAGFYAVYDKANDKLKVFVRTTGVEVANATDLSGTTFKLCVLAC
jgi:hypothetical protein